MTLLNTLTRKTAKVRTERKLTVSKTNVFVPKFDGTKTCLPLLSSPLAKVSRWDWPPCGGMAGWSSGHPTSAQLHLGTNNINNIRN